MAFEAGSIIGNLELRTANYDAGIEHAEKEALDAEKKMDEAFEEVRNSLENALGQMIGQMGDGLGLAAKGAVDSIQGISKAIDAIDSENPKELIQGCEQALEGLMEIAEGFAEVVEHVAHAFHEVELAAIKTGTSTEFMSHLEAQANAAGTSLDTVVMGMKILEQRAEMANEGNKEAAAGFARLGISAKEAAELASDPQGLYEAVQGKISGMTDAAERNAAALGVMGRQGFNLVPVLTMTADEMKRLGDFSDQVGATVSDNDADMAKSFNALSTEFSLMMKGIEAEAARPILQFLQDHASELEETMKDLAAVGRDVLGPVFKWIGDVAGDLAPVIRDLAHEFRALVEDAEKAWSFIHGNGWTLPAAPATGAAKSEANPTYNVTVLTDPSDSVTQLGRLVQDAVRRGKMESAATLEIARRTMSVVQTVSDGTGGGW